VNNIPPKACTYACVYCQVGRTSPMRVERSAWYPPEDLAAEVSAAVERVIGRGGRIDFLTIVPDGEPTLDVNLGRLIGLLRPLGIDVAVISNGSLLDRKDVRRDLMDVDWVSLKVDAVRTDTWRRIDRPHGRLQLAEILDGMLRFAAKYEGRLVTETMLVRGLNDDEESIGDLASFLARLGPSVAYLGIPTRPPLEDWVRAPDEETLARAWHALDGSLEKVEYLTGYEGDEFTSSGPIVADLLGITSVHPMRERAVREMLARAGADWSVVRSLLDQRELIETRYAGHTYFVRPLRRAPRKKP